VDTSYSSLDPSRTETAAEITRGIVQLLKDVVGRGPVGAHTYLAPNLAVTVLDKCMTQSERTLVAAGNTDQVKQLRLHIQDAFAKPARELVERATGREVISFMSDHDVVADVAVEVFVLSPA
jgi:uncharacterized protein YbcI